MNQPTHSPWKEVWAMWHPDKGDLADHCTQDNPQEWTRKGDYARCPVSNEVLCYPNSSFLHPDSYAAKNGWIAVRIDSKEDKT